MDILSILQQQCPVCHQGAVFGGLLHTNTHCPHCGIKFEREPGYFTMAMYVSYAIGAVLFVPPTILLTVQRAPNLAFAGVAFGVVCASPFIFRYSRVIWLHLDQMISPREKDH